MSRLLIGIFLSLLSVSGTAREIDKERSIYRNVVITEEDKLRCMRFETRRKKITNQACIDLRDPERLVFEYAHGVMAGYAINPQPKRILIIGLGGGVLSKVLHQLSPQAEIVSVEIDPVVVNLAKKHFGYEENEKVKTVVKDGRVFVKRALLKKEKFDWIMLDAFNGDYIPEHLMTKEFLAEVKGLLSDNGVLTANTFSNSRLYDFESVTYQKVFGKLHIFQAPTKGNRVIFACNCSSFESFPDAPKELQSKVSRYQVDLKKVWGLISDTVDWNTESEILTDQYSPANLLKRLD
ncbi:spermidine synthase [Aliikangiella coralliicola]|uniref:Methyltransferase domain-containing protein n=1 Tax=Aliikangiella coralliicola TaxID=2592383 RepID=A0A545UF62_9GAMM|nr:fused MFS/spermidine synthase [Aliikangiella coralliicola]TQV88109.1 methyltransferase domain-containing protein [Aliikangiella coralliicola]